MSELKIENLNLSLDNNIILEDINLSIKAGEYVGLIGPNGAGKSSLLKCILGLKQFDTGKITTGAGVKFAYVPQHFLGESGFALSVYEVIRMGLNKDILFDTRNKRRKILDALLKVDLKESILNENFLNLSGGQKQRVVIARALVSEPNFLIFDEAFSNIDMNSKILIYDLLAHINQSDNTTILFVSHEVDTIIQKCKRVLCLNKHLHEGCHPIKFMEGKIVENSKLKDNLSLISHHHNHSKC